MSLWEASKKRLVSIVFSDGYRKTAAYFLALGFTNGKKNVLSYFSNKA